MDPKHMSQTNSSNSTRPATLRITAAGRRIFSRAITPTTADAVMQEAQAALEGHNDAVLELDTACADEELQRVKSGSADAWLFIQAGLEPLNNLRAFCLHNPSIVQDAAQSHGSCRGPAGPMRQALRSLCECGLATSSDVPGAGMRSYRLTAEGVRAKAAPHGQETRL